MTEEFLSKPDSEKIYAQEPLFQEILFLFTDIQRPDFRRRFRSKQKGVRAEVFRRVDRRHHLDGGWV
ncbi:MAG: hypothetical protein R2747_00490 [Pyrinomonadaceae bacterium]